jgi:hypothetical protein
VLTVNRLKAISGKVELPPSSDLFLVAAFAALASCRTARIHPIGKGAEIRKWAALLSGHAAVTLEGDACLIERANGGAPGTITFANDQLPYRDLVLFLALGAGKRIVFATIPEKRLEAWRATGRRLGVELAPVQEGALQGLVCAQVNSATPPPREIEERDINAGLGFFFGLRAKRIFRTSFTLSNPFRHCAACFGGAIEVKRDTGEREKDPLLRRIKLQTGQRLSEQEQSFLVTTDFSLPPPTGEPVDIELPGDEALLALFCTAKSLVQRGSLVIDNAPLEPWALPIIQFLRKMGCKPSLQEMRRTSFGAAGMLSLSRFDLSGQKIDFAPQHPAAMQLPAMAMVAAFAENQSLFRQFEDLRRSDPDGIRQLESCLKTMSVKFGDIPDGFVIKGEKEYDGFDLIEPLPAPCAGAFTMAGLRCIGSTTVNDERIIERWPDFYEMIMNVGEVRSQQ